MLFQTIAYLCTKFHLKQLAGIAFKGDLPRFVIKLVIRFPCVLLRTNLNG